MRSKAKLVAFCSVLAVATAGCTGGGNNSSATQGGHLIIGTTSNIDTMNPFVTFQQNSYAAFEYIYPQLSQFDAEGQKLLPDFATKWTTSADGLVWTFSTVPNATWSDGQPLTAKDADFTFNTILKYGDGPAGNLVGGLANVRSVKAIGDNTLVVTYSTPAANVLQELQGIPILPEHVWQQYATGDGKGLRQFPNLPENGQPLVSGGPFELAQYTKDSTAIFAANDKFYGPKPEIDGFGLQYFSNDDAISRRCGAARSRRRSTSLRPRWRR